MISKIDSRQTKNKQLSRIDTQADETLDIILDKIDEEIVLNTSNATLDNAIPRFDGISGKDIQSSSAIITDDGNLIANSVTSSLNFFEGLSVNNTLTGENANLTITTPIVKLTNTALESINTITNPIVGRNITIINSTGKSIIINNDQGLIENNRILTGLKDVLPVEDEASIVLKYDNIGNRWMVVGGTGGGGSTSLLFEVDQPNTLNVLNAVYNNNGIWSLAKADNENTLATHIVVKKNAANPNKFSLAQIGRYTYKVSPHIKKHNEYYFLSDRFGVDVLFTDASAVNITVNGILYSLSGTAAAKATSLATSLNLISGYRATAIDAYVSIETPTSVTVSTSNAAVGAISGPITALGFATPVKPSFGFDNLLFSSIDDLTLDFMCYRPIALGGISSASNVPNVAFIKDIKPNGTNAGSSVAASWITRELNTLEDTSSIVVSLVGNEFTLRSGSYEIDIESSVDPAAGKNKIRLINVTSSTTELTGLSNRPSLKGQILVSGITSFRIEHFTELLDANGLGEATNSGDQEVYTILKVTRL